MASRLLFIIKLIHGHTIECAVSLSFLANYAYQFISITVKKPS